MVNYKQDAVGRTFGALADPTRRGIVASLARHGEMTVSALARPFEASLPAMLKHLGVLDAAGLVAREKRGRSVWYRLRPQPLDETRAWLERMRGFWSESLDNLEHYLEEHPCPPRAQPSATTPVSSSNAASTPRRPRCGPPGPKRRR